MVDRVVADGLRRGSMVGASDSQIDGWANAQNVSIVPVAVREVLRLIGMQSSLWLSGSLFGVKSLGPGSKRAALATLRAFGDSMADSSGMLVLVDHQSYLFYAIDGADLNELDPPVWAISEGGFAEQGWPSVTDWLDAIAPDVARTRERLAFQREQGWWIDPAWSPHIELD
ncbi:hypothetical protein GL305_26985 [Nocardia seriolae]|uniref:hypothetical protein n=1 Tax=Nocardia seriolae TaxID=37332 RepID=UPI00117F9B5F|nr:hypothetical protein [Nocardia seriolae]MTJ73024.1 hypothetical protein [Nocardia seriolae]MTK33483.1 hypothetical protein [Nocardia seriolae]MTK50075.1 hypothetical protein [Nocardia seriolae]MTL15044.1 hypothetical protein [Nocardia seriolae]